MRKKVIFIVFLFFPLATLFGLEQFFHPRYGFTVSIPKGWRFVVGNTEELLLSMHHPEKKATIYMSTNRIPLSIQSEEDFRNRFVKVLEQHLTKEISEMQEIRKPVVKFEKDIWHVTLRIKGKTPDTQEVYQSQYDVFVYGEPGFGQRFLALVTAAPNKHWGSQDIQKAFQKVRQSLTLPSKIQRPFPYESFRISFKQALLLLITCLIILTAILYRVIQRSREE